MKVDIPLKIKLSFVAFDEYSRCEVSDTGSKNRLDLTLKKTKSWNDVVEYFEEKWKLVSNLKSRIKIFFIDVKGRQSVDMISTFPTTSVCDTLSLHPSVLTFQQSSSAGSSKAKASAEEESLIIQMHYTLSSLDVIQDTGTIAKPIGLDGAVFKNGKSKKDAGNRGKSTALPMSCNRSSKVKNNRTNKSQKMSITDGQTQPQHLQGKKENSVWNRYAANDFCSTKNVDQIQGFNLTGQMPPDSSFGPGPGPGSDAIPVNVYSTEFSQSLWNQSGFEVSLLGDFHHCQTGTSPNKESAFPSGSYPEGNMFSPIRRLTAGSTADTAVEAEDTMDMIGRIACKLKNFPSSSSFASSPMQPFFRNNSPSQSLPYFSNSSKTEKSDKPALQSVTNDPPVNPVDSVITSIAELSPLLDVAFEKTSKFGISTRIPPTRIGEVRLAESNAEMSVNRAERDTPNTPNTPCRLSRMLNSFEGAVSNLSAFGFPSNSLIMFDGGITGGTELAFNSTDPFQNEKGLLSQDREERRALSTRHDFQMLDSICFFSNIGSVLEPFIPDSGLESEGPGSSRMLTRGATEDNSESEKCGSKHSNSVKRAALLLIADTDTGNVHSSCPNGGAENTERVQYPCNSSPLSIISPSSFSFSAFPDTVSEPYDCPPCGVVPFGTQTPVGPTLPTAVQCGEGGDSPKNAPVQSQSAALKYDTPSVSATFHATEGSEVGVQVLCVGESNGVDGPAARPTAYLSLEPAVSENTSCVNQSRGSAAGGRSSSDHATTPAAALTHATAAATLLPPSHLSNTSVAPDSAPRSNEDGVNRPDVATGVRLFGFIEKVDESRKRGDLVRSSPLLLAGHEREGVGKRMAEINSRSDEMKEEEKEGERTKNIPSTVDLDSRVHTDDLMEERRKALICSDHVGRCDAGDGDRDGNGNRDNDKERNRDSLSGLSVSRRSPVPDAGHLLLRFELSTPPSVPPCSSTPFMKPLPSALSSTSTPTPPLTPAPSAPSSSSPTSSFIPISSSGLCPSKTKRKNIDDYYIRENSPKERSRRNVTKSNEISADNDNAMSETVAILKKRKRQRDRSKEKEKERAERDSSESSTDSDNNDTETERDVSLGGEDMDKCRYGFSTHNALGDAHHKIRDGICPAERTACDASSVSTEGRKLNIIKQLTQKASSGGPFVHSFVDATYGRTSFYLMGEDLVKRSLDLCKEAVKLIKFDPTLGTHPALGVVDHISFSPIGPDSSMTEASSMALEFANELYSHEKIPVFTYGEASPTKLFLKDIRKELGYFLKVDDMIENMRKSNAIPVLGNMKEDFDSHKGIACVGAINYLQNLNMRFRPTDERKNVIQIAKYLRDPDVEALTLQHEDGAYEVACNLRRPRIITSDAVLAKADEAITTLGLRDQLAIVCSYTTGPTEMELYSKITKN